MNLTNRQIVIKILPVTILFVTIYSIVGFSKHVPSFFTNTIIWWGISAIILIVFLQSSIYFYDHKNNSNMKFVLIYLIWSIFSVVRGVFVAEMYWDWKLLINNFMIFMLALIAYSGTNKVLVQSILSYYIKYVLPLFLIFAIIIRTDAYGFYLMTTSILILFLPVFTLRQKTVILITMFVVFISDLGARSNVIKFGIPLALLLIYRYRNIISMKLMEVFRVLLFVIPVALFILGASGTFNVFKIQEYMGKDVNVMGTDEKGNRTEESFVADTRTFLYEEVIHSALNNNYLLLGRTPARGNDSNTFGLIQFEWTGRYERESNEIGLANVFTWTGLVGVIIYTMVFFHASYLAVNRSKNIFIKLMGLYLAFRWLYSWIEDYQTFSLNYYLLMLMWGMCLSVSFRNMTDNEFAIWARGIFDARYIRFQSLLIKKTIYEKYKNSSTSDVS